MLGEQREAFAVPPEIAYFNTATLSPQLHAVRTAGEAALERRGRPWTIAADDWFSDVERLRALYAGLVGADAEGVALIPAAPACSRPSRRPTASRQCAGRRYASPRTCTSPMPTSSA